MQTRHWQVNKFKFKYVYEEQTQNLQILKTISQIVQKTYDKTPKIEPRSGLSSLDIDTHSTIKKNI